MNNYLEEYDKYKDCKLPELNEIFNHPTQKHGSLGQPIQYQVLEYKDDKGTVETIHSKWKVERTLHWIRKTYNRLA